METLPQRKSGEGWLVTVIALLIVLITLLHCTRRSIDLSSILGSGSLPRIRVTAADALVWAAFGLWFITCLGKVGTGKSGACPHFSKAPIAAAFLLLWALLSIVPQLKGGGSSALTIGKAAGMRDFVKLLEFFVAAYLLYAVFARRRGMLKAIMLALFAGATVSLCWAWYEYLHAAVKAMRISAAFDNRNTFAAYLALIVPMLMGYALWSKSGLWRAWGIALTAAALGVVTAGGQFLAMVVGLLIVLFLYRRWLLPVAGAVIVLAFALIFPHLPRRNDALLLESVALYRTHDAAGALAGRLENAAVRSGENQFKTESDYSWPWQQRYQEWQAAGNMMMAYPLFGIGAGSYQENVNNFYQRGIALPAKFAGENLMEEDALSMYTVWGACLGLPGLLFIFWLIIGFFHRAVDGLRNPDGQWRGVAAGGVGALASLCIAGVFTDFIAGGVGISLAIVLGLIAASDEDVKGETS